MKLSEKMRLDANWAGAHKLLSFELVRDLAQEYEKHEGATGKAFLKKELDSANANGDHLKIDIVRYYLNSLQDDNA